jgi:hypothetical protein
MNEYVVPRDWASKTATESRVFHRVDSAQTPLRVIANLSGPVVVLKRNENYFQLQRTITEHAGLQSAGWMWAPVLRENTVVSLLHRINQNRRNRTSINTKRTFINL